MFIGVFDARMFGPSCMQPRLPRSGRRTIDIWNPDNEFKENCLTLNIWTPYIQDEQTRQSWYASEHY